MIFNSFEFFAFLPLAWALFWTLNGHLRQQNLLVVVKVILPVGISFYTFQALSYTIDVYRW